MDLITLRRFLESHLLDHVVPFWERHALDPRGGINTCIRDNGKRINDEKLMWSQCRAVYTFSALYNRIEKRQAWLDIATRILQFCLAHGRDEDGRWVFKVDAEGHVLEPATSIYVDGFFLQGVSEWLRAVDDAAVRIVALDTFENVRRRLAVPGSYASAPYAVPAGMKAHGISMIFSSAFFELGQVTGEQAVRDEALAHAEQVMCDFWRPELDALLEYVTQDGLPRTDLPLGRVVIPGHAIESMWFQIHQYAALERWDRVRECVACIRQHMERGWDHTYGGLFLACDVLGREPVAWEHAKTKLWWPHTEALYALLLAHAVSREAWCLEWYERVHAVAFKHYPSPHGEWIQKQDRQFRPIRKTLVLPVKDPFHLPRALVLCIELLRGGGGGPCLARSDAPWAATGEETP
jgi:N-acylglucosamine 2-epimerase